MKQQLFLVYHGRYPSEKAAALFAAKSAEAFANNGVAVTLIVPRRLDRVRDDSYDYFPVRRNFSTVFLPTIDIYWMPILGRFAHQVSYSAFSAALAVYLLFRARDSWVVSNEYVPILFASFVSPNTLYELHDFPEGSRWLYARMFRGVRKVLATNAWKAQALEKEFHVPKQKIITEPNAVDLAPYKDGPSRAEARKKLGLSLDISLVVYTGHLYPWKGVDTLIEAAKKLSEVVVYIVGGSSHDLAKYRAEFGAVENCVFVGHRPHVEMLLWHRAADVLVLPNTAKEELSARYTSPMKLFEYMASGTPIVASDLPSIREITHDGLAYLVAPDSPRALVEGIREAVRGSTMERAYAAADWVTDHSWDKRARRILASLAEPNSHTS